MWGWTAWPQQQSLAAMESPTHVGMDRTVLIGRCRWIGEPHARGDGPITSFGTTVCLRAPRTWGWTADPPPQVDRRLESPTHVGMDHGGAPPTLGGARESPTHVGMGGRARSLGRPGGGAGPQ